MAARPRKKEYRHLPDHLYFDKDKGAYIRFRLTIRDVATGTEKQQYWNVRLTYRIEPQIEMASGERNNNPLKFVVTSYARDKEDKG